MLKLFCPHCLKPVSVPEDSAGKDAPCPECGKAFPVPSRYNPIVSTSPPPIVPPPPLPSPVEAVASPTPPAPLPQITTPALPTGYTHSRGFTISPCVVAWIPAVALTAILLLTLTPWVGVYPGGTAVYTQGAWRSITGRPTRNFQNEDLMLKELPAPSVYDRTVSDWLIMLPYIVALLLAIVLAWAERLEKSGASTRLPKLLPALWPFRHLVIAGLVGAALLLLSLEATRGFGLERAMHAAVTDKFDTQRKDAKTPGEHHRIDYLEGKELAGFGLERTGWFCLVLSLHVLAVLAMLGRVGLERRGNKPPPRIVLQY